jgi:hypothetical protein
MYCSFCSAEITPGLKYCKRCGVNLSSNVKAPPQKKFPLALTLAFLALIGFVLSVGMVVPFAVASETMSRGVNVDSLMPLLVLIPLIAFGVVGLLVWLLLRLIKVHQQSGSSTQLIEPRRDPPVDYTPARIAAPPEKIVSVTEHTTRNFDSIEDRLPPRESVKDTR